MSKESYKDRNAAVAQGELQPRIPREGEDDHGLEKIPRRSDQRGTQIIENRFCYWRLNECL